VTVASTAQEVLSLLAIGERPDLLILDLEVPFVSETELLLQLRTFYPMLPTLIHSFPPETPLSPMLWPNAVFLEKGENPGHLKAKVAEILRQGRRGQEGQADLGDAAAD